MIKVTFKTPDGIYWAKCEKMNYVKGSGFFMKNVIEDSDSQGSWIWAKTPEAWKILAVEGA